MRRSSSPASSSVHKGVAYSPNVSPYGSPRTSPPDSGTNSPQVSPRASPTPRRRGIQKLISRKKKRVRCVIISVSVCRRTVRNAFVTV